MILGLEENEEIKIRNVFKFESFLSAKTRYKLGYKPIILRR